MRIGRMRHRLSIEAPTETRDAAGGVTQTWAEATKRWGFIEPLKGSEQISSAQQSSTVSHRITMRYYASLTTRHRIVYDGRTFGVVAVTNPDGVKRRTEALVTEETV